MPPTLTLTGLTGRSSVYHACAFDAVWKDIPGCYAFVTDESGRLEADALRVLYVGETASFRLRMREHREATWADALRLGATHVSSPASLHARRRSGT